jgi:eukaryotic-like serine/threonine-protein kinase
MDFRILGPLEVLEGDRPIALGGTRRKALLAALLLRANQVVSSERLIDELWGEDLPERAANALQVHISGLRKALGKGRLETRPPGYVLQVATDELDLNRFTRLRDEGRFEEALSLWRGPPLADFAYADFAQSEIDRLEELRLVCLEDRIERDLANGRHAELIGELEALVAGHPLRERPRAQLMLCLYRAGRQAEALEAYQSARTLLVEELGIEPGRPLRELHTAILRQDAALDPPRSATAQPGAFVGRTTEMAELVAGLDDAFAGRGRLFLLSGEPGIGKTRLAEELSARARARGARVVFGRCWEAGGAPAYWPWVQSLRAYTAEMDPGSLRAQLGAGAVDLAQMVPELREQFADMPEPAPTEADGARFRLFDATARFLQKAAEQRPLVVLLDDLHAADEPSLLLLQFVARELPSMRVLILGAYRDVDPILGSPLTEFFREVAREPVASRFTLGGLAEGEVGTYVDITASELASPALIAALHRETEGNPLFVGEIVRLLSLEGGQSDIDGDVRLAVPDSVHDVIARRLAHLSPECRRVLVLASVLGREFALSPLAQMSALSEDDVLDELDGAMAARVVSDVSAGSGRLRFAHVLIRDTLYDGLTHARRIKLHRLAMEALETLYGERAGVHLSELAHHAIAGSDLERGVRYARRAGDHALALLAYEESARQYRAALEALDVVSPSDETARCELLLSIGEAEARSGDGVTAKRTFVEAADVARRVGLARELARAAMGYGGRIVWARAGPDDRLVPLLEEALAALGDEDDKLRSTLLARLAGALRDERTRERRDQVSRDAVELARRTNDPEVLAYALDGRASAIHGPDRLDECLGLGTELRELAARIGDRERVVAGHMIRIMMLLTLGDVRAAEADLAASTRIAEDLRQPAQLWQAYSTQALVALAAGRFSEAEPLMEHSLALGERAQRGEAIPVYQGQRYMLSDFRGTLHEVEPAVRSLAVGNPARPVFRCALANLQARTGRLPEAKRALDELARDEFGAVPFDQEWLFAMTLLAEAAAELRDSAAAPLLYEFLSPYGELNAVDVGEGIRGSVARYLGLLAATTKRWTDAAAHFDAALEMNDRMEARPWLARTQGDYARMLIARGRPGDRKVASRLLSEAEASYLELGMHAPLADPRQTFGGPLGDQTTPNAG